MEFDKVVGALATLVLVATIVERMLAFVFEHKWFVKLATRADGHSNLPGLRGVLALAASMGISFGYDFDILAVLFPEAPNPATGKIVTGFVIAGGSSGALAIFQGYLGIGKQSRDAIIEARKAEATSTKEVAELAVAEAQAKRDEAQARRDQAQADKTAAELKAQALRQAPSPAAPDRGDADNGSQTA